MEDERNDQDEDVIILGDNLRKNPQRAKRGKNARYDEIPVNLNPEPDVDSDAEDHKIMVPAHIEKPFMKSNRIYYVVLGDKSPVSRCHGCEGEISEKSKKRPKIWCSCTNCGVLSLHGGEGMVDGLCLATGETVISMHAIWGV